MTRQNYRAINKPLTNDKGSMFPDRLNGSGFLCLTVIAVSPFRRRFSSSMIYNYYI